MKRLLTILTVAIFTIFLMSCEPSEDVKPKENGVVVNNGDSDQRQSFEAEL